MPTDGMDVAEGKIFLAPRQDIKSCAELVHALREGLAAYSVLAINAGALESGDYTLVQTLLAAARSAHTLGTRMEIRPPYQTLASLFERCGLSPAKLDLFVSDNLEAPHDQDGSLRR